MCFNQRVRVSELPIIRLTRFRSGAELGGMISSNERASRSVLLGVLLAINSLLFSACAQESMSCIPNVTRTCVCLSGAGVQACMASGLGYTPCACAIPDSGVQTDAPTAVVDVPNFDRPNPTVDVPAVDVPSGPVCAMGPENTVAACSDNCSNDADNFVDCNDFDCCNVVACGPTTSCGRRAMCTACDAMGMCGAGLVCARRRCDAVAGCYPADPTASCDTIAGNACPMTAAYDRCTMNADNGGCGPNAICQIDSGTSVPWGVSRCSRILGYGLDPANCTQFGPNACPLPPPAFVGISAACETNRFGAVGRVRFGCALLCAAGAMCPYGLRCVTGRCID